MPSAIPTTGSSPPAPGSPIHAASPPSVPRSAVIRQKKIALSPLIPTGSVEGSAGLRLPVLPPALAYAAFASPRFLPLGPGGAARATLSPRRHTAARADLRAEIASWRRTA